MATADTILAWLRQARDHAFRVEGREASTCDPRAARGGRRPLCILSNARGS